MKNRLNFAPHPFSSGERPLLYLWLANAVALAAVAFLIWHWRQLKDANAAVHTQLDGLKAEQRDLVTGHGRLLDQLEAVNTRVYHKQIRQFHGIQSSFSAHWGLLLDDLAALLPEDVRLTQLRPASGGGSRLQETGSHLILTGQARNKAAQLAFIRKLQDRSGFLEVRLDTERYDVEGAALVFELRFYYRVPGQSNG